jgi:glycosyltransferase involved in cell wall biosynthesis
LRLAFVIQRYGLEVNGGAELHCRWLAERLAQRHQVEVFATRALDYLEWKNHYPRGTEVVNGIPVHRSTVKRTRNARVFASLSNICFHETHTRDEELAWVRENGPYSPELVGAVAAARERFDRFFFYCYRYYQSFHGVPAVPERAILVPTAEEDPAIRLEVMKPLFRAPRGLVYLTPEEQALVVDRNKGALTLFAYVKKFLEETGADVDLVLAGKSVVNIPEHPRIRHVGFITEEEKVAALRQCRLLVMPSPFESLSVIVLEAWKLGVPVLANARCKVLAGQCLRSNGGLFYHGYSEFAEGLKLLLQDDGVARALGRQGKSYVDREYAWETIDSKMEDLLARTA